MVSYKMIAGLQVGESAIDPPVNIKKARSYFKIAQDIQPENHWVWFLSSVYDDYEKNQSPVKSGFQYLVTLPSCPEWMKIIANAYIKKPGFSALNKDSPVYRFIHY